MQDLASAKLAVAVVGARHARNWTQRELAHRAGLGIGTLSRIENGHGTTVRSLVALARVLQLDLGALFDLDRAAAA